MARDYAEIEREFLDNLKPDTGRNLDEWMQAIRASGITDRNALIDWLRGHAMTFERASRLERLWANGGKPLYGEPEVALEEHLKKAKAYRPLGQMLLDRIAATLPALVVRPLPAYVSLGAPKEFGAVIMSAKEVRLGLDLGDAGADPRLEAGRIKGTPARISHGIALTDARLIDARLMALVKAAAERVNV